MHRIQSTDTTEEIVQEIGSRLRGYRLQQNVTIADLATRAGIGSATATRAETGRNTSIETIVRMLRALGRLDALDAILPAPLVSPIQLAARRGRQSRRARQRHVPRPASTRIPDPRPNEQSARNGHYLAPTLHDRVSPSDFAVARIRLWVERWAPSPKHLTGALLRVRGLISVVRARSLADPSPR